MDNVDDDRIVPGCRVKVFDGRLFRNDRITPLSFTVRPATVVARYGTRTKGSMDDPPRTYPDLIDVLFDHRPESVSKGHFTSGAKVLDEQPHEQPLAATSKE